MQVNTVLNFYPCHVMIEWGITSSFSRDDYVAYCFFSTWRINTYYKIPILLRKLFFVSIDSVI